jgi:hypothetical protein
MGAHNGSGWPMITVTVTRSELRKLQVCVSIVDAMPKPAKHVLSDLPELADKLGEELSRPRQELLSEMGELEMTDELIGSKEAGEILGWARRSVQRHAAALGGERVGHAWLFDRTTVLNFKREAVA